MLIDKAFLANVLVAILVAVVLYAILYFIEVHGLRSVVIGFTGFGLLCALPLYGVWFFIDMQGAIHSPWFWSATICLLGVLEWLKRDQ